MDQSYQNKTFLAKILSKNPIIQFSNNKEHWKTCFVKKADYENNILTKEVEEAKWVTINPAWWKQIIVVDIDPEDYQEETINKMISLGLKPNYIVKNPEKPLSLQLGFLLKDGIYDKNGQKNWKKRRADRRKRALKELGIEQPKQPKKAKNQSLPFPEIEDKWEENRRKWEKGLEDQLVAFNLAKTNLYQLFKADHHMANGKAKNPLSPFWQVEWGKEKAYELEELLKIILVIKNPEHDYKFYDGLGLLSLIEVLEDKEEQEQEKKQEKEEKSIFPKYAETKDKGQNRSYHFDPNSSNCQNFDHLRMIAYQWCKDFRREFEDQEVAKQYLFNFLKENEDPEIYKHQTLSEREATIKSIVKYCFRLDISQYEHLFYAKTNKRRKDKQMENILFLKANYEQKLNQKFSKQDKEEIANLLKVKLKTVEVYISKARKLAQAKPSNENILEEIKKLKDEQKLNFKTIAQKLDIKENTAKTIYYRHKKKQTPIE